MTAIAWSQLSRSLLDDLFNAEALRFDLGERYRVEEGIGEGGQGRVFRGIDRLCNRPVAIKVAKYRPSHLRAEAELLSQLAHPTVSQVFDVGMTPDGLDFLVMQLVGGLRLDVWLEQEGVDLDRRLRLFVRLAEGMAHAHALGVLHRDLKPDNIVVMHADQPVILDWGLSARGGKRSICGSPHFAAPEQLEGHPVTHRADVFALGVLLYVMITGRLPYAREATDFQEFRRVRAGLVLVPLRKRAPSVPARLETVVARAMSAQPGARHPQVEHLIADVEQVREQLRRRRSNRVGWWLVLALACLVLGLVLGWLAHQHVQTGPVDPLTGRSHSAAARPMGALP